MSLMINKMMISRIEKKFKSLEIMEIESAFICAYIRKKMCIRDRSMMMSIALRFIPILIEETDKIMKAQMARGADFESGNLIQKAKNMVPLLVPLFISAFRRATDLAMAMEARCYRGGEGRTKMKPLHYNRADRFAYVIYAASVSYTHLDVYKRQTLNNP